MQLRMLCMIVVKFPSCKQRSKGEKEEVEAKAVGPFLLQQACGGMRERS